VVAFARSPMDVAYQAWDLARYSRGRFTLGLGTQVAAHITRRFGMTWPEHPAEAFRDYVTALRAIWRAWQTGEPLNHRGPAYKLTIMTPFFNPGPQPWPHIPIFTAGVGRPMCRLAGEVADGFHAHPLHSPRYLAEVVRPAIAEGAAAAGRPASDVEVSSGVFVACGATQAETDRAVEAVRKQISFYASTPTYGPVLGLHGWEDAHDQLRRLAARRCWEEMPALVTDEMVDSFSLVCRWDELASRMRERYTGLLDRVTLYRPFDPADDTVPWADVCRAFETGR